MSLALVPRLAVRLLVLFAAIACGVLASAPVARAASPSESLAVYAGAANPDGVGTFGAWVGRRPGVAVDFLAGSSWSDIAGAEWWADGWAGSGLTVVYSVPLLPASGGTLQEGADGAYDRHFRRLAEVLVARGQGNAILRLGWEMNGDWYRWSIAGGPGAFAAYWRRVVNVMRSVSPAFRFDYSVNMGSSTVGGKQLDPADAYPGDAYVDFVGMSVYDQGWGPDYRDPQARWRQNMEMPFGLEWHRRFAAAHGKPMSFPEWALTERDDGHGGGDAPYFIERMHDWIARNPVAYHAYFEFDAPDGKHALMNGQFPRSAARFRQLFGPGGDAGSAPDRRPQPAPRQRKRPRARGNDGRPVLRAKLLGRGVRAASARRRVALRWHARGPVNVFHNGRRIAHDVKPKRRRLVVSIRRHSRARHYFRVCRADAPKSCSRRATVRVARRVARR